MIMREQKRAKLVRKYAKKRAQLKAVIRDLSTSDEEKAAAQAKLNALPRDSSPTRMRKRCAITGRPHAITSTGIPREPTMSRQRRYASGSPVSARSPVPSRWASHKS